MNFFKTFLASLLGTFVALGLISVFFFMGIAAIATSVNFDKAEGAWISENSVLDLNLNTVVVDRSPKANPFDNFSDFSESRVGLDEILGSINKAKKDNKIKGVRLKSGFINSGWVQAREIRKALNDFKSSGKFIYAYADYISQKGLYLSSVADSLFLNPMGIVELKGLSSEVLYYEGFQDQYGVKMEVIRHGKYKSAVEPFLQSEMSDENRQQIQGILKSVWETLRDEVATSRGLEPETIDAIAEDMLVGDAQSAFEQGIIDGMIYEEDFDNKIKSALGLELDKEFKTVEFTKMNVRIKEFNVEIDDRIAALETGADDFISKPFNVREVLARVKALIRRSTLTQGAFSNELSSDLIEVGSLVLNRAERTCTINGTALILTVREFDLLDCFMRHPRQALSRGQLIQHVWGDDYFGDENVVDVFVRYLRKKLEETGSERVIQTVRGVGFVLRMNDQ